MRGDKLPSSNAMPECVSIGPPVHACRFAALEEINSLSPPYSSAQYNVTRMFAGCFSVAGLSGCGGTAGTARDRQVCRGGRGLLCS